MFTFALSHGASIFVVVAFRQYLRLSIFSCFLFIHHLTSVPLYFFLFFCLVIRRRVNVRSSTSSSYSQCTVCFVSLSSPLGFLFIYFFSLFFSFFHLLSSVSLSVFRVLIVYLASVRVFNVFIFHIAVGMCSRFLCLMVRRFLLSLLFANISLSLFCLQYQSMFYLCPSLNLRPPLPIKCASTEHWMVMRMHSRTSTKMSTRARPTRKSLRR